MSMEKINDEVLGTIAGGMSRNLKAAYDAYDGKYATTTRPCSVWSTAWSRATTRSPRT